MPDLLFLQLVGNLNGGLTLFGIFAKHCGHAGLKGEPFSSCFSRTSSYALPIKSNASSFLAHLKIQKNQQKIKNMLC